MNREISNPLDQDWAWIQSFQQGRSSAFEALFNKYKNTVIHLSYRFVKDRHAAEEIAQEVFIKIYEKKVKFDPKSKFSTWLYRVTVNASLDLIRQKNRRPYSLNDELRMTNDGRKEENFLETIAASDSASPVRTAAANELRLAVRQAIDQLPEKLRAAILLFQFQELSYQEIAQVLGTTPKTVERRIAHARSILRGKLAHCL